MMEKKDRIHQDTTYDNLVKRLGHCWGWGVVESPGVAVSAELAGEEESCVLVCV